MGTVDNSKLDSSTFHTENGITGNREKLKGKILLRIILKIADRR